MSFDILLKNGRFFDGLGSASEIRDVAIRDGRVAAIDAAIPAESAARVIDATGKWITPGFVDAHTHYDAEVLLSPGLCESARHGVTTVFIGNCSLSTIHCDPLDCADLFSRVEALPREHVLAALEERKTWTNAADYARALEALPLGPNVAAFLGHSDARAAVMGLGRSTERRVTATERELAAIEKHLEDALDAGFLGLSTQTTTFDKLDGDRYRSRPLPSTFAPWSEYRRLHRILRRRGRVVQSAPNAANPLNVFGFLAASAGAFVRDRLKVSLLVSADAKALPGVSRVVATLTRIWNALTRADLRWQHLPVPFDIYADGIDLVVFEELGAGRAALHLKEKLERDRLFANDGYREQFRREYDKGRGAGVWHRDFHDATIVECPDASLVGLTFGAIGDRRGVHPVDAFLDLVVEHGTRVRWRTLIANHQPRVLDQLSAHPVVHMGFADSGAHLRNMAFYNFPIRLLRRVREAERAGRPFMTVERAVHRLTGEIASWFSLDAGTLRTGDRADVAVVDPSALDASVDGYYEAAMPEFGGVRRMVNRSGGAVAATVIGGRVAFESGSFAPGYGESVKHGRFLRAGERVAPAIERVAASV